ncbi:allophanate hydrolase subunit 1 [Lewinella sp. 4G2]|uniref:5-oxoprolinase subunit B family protein n=1 Tax=Lewinella sp. 4G2 TaxID=1803372 RepID=UPI0007B4AE2A|nr:allophanate hydrolase subunit 1 [Lewinella sp. 4G2]OAV45718.1 hypothetical protein A3850_014995 [Lewinella sp. 4G2]
MRKPRRILNYGERALLLEWEQVIHPEISHGVHTYQHALLSWPGIEEAVPAYASLLLVFETPHWSTDRLRETLYNWSPRSVESFPGREYVLPVHYNGIDLGDVAHRQGLSIEELIQKHTARTYLVYQLGFRPGFAFLGDLDEGLQLPRLASPRKHVAAGTVAIAGAQTAVYPTESPGGWHQLGHCPVPLIPSLPGTASVSLQAGDQVRFTAVDESTYQSILKNPGPWITQRH